MQKQNGNTFPDSFDFYPQKYFKNLNFIYVKQIKASRSEHRLKDADHFCHFELWQSPLIQQIFNV